MAKRIQEVVEPLESDTAEIHGEIDALNEEAWRIRWSNSERSRELGQRAYQLALTHNYMRGAAYGLRNVAHADLSHSDYEKAIEGATESLGLFEAIGDRRGQAGIMYMLGGCNRRLGNPEDARQCYEQSLAISRETGDKLDEAWACLGLGAYYKGTGDGTKAIELNLLSHALGAESGDLEIQAHALNGIGTTYEWLGEYHRALDYYLQSLELAKQLAHERLIPYVTENIGIIYERLGDNITALDYSLRGLAYKESVGDRWGMGVSYNNIGYTYKILGDYARSLENYLLSLRITEEIGDKMGQAAALNNIGQLYEAIGDDTHVLDYYLRSLRISQEIGDITSAAFSLTHIGGLYRHRGDVARALMYYLKCLRSYEEHQDRYGQRGVLSYLGVVYKSIGDYDKAEECLLRGLAIAQEVGGRDGEAEALLSLGELQAARAEYDLAIESMRRVLEIAREIGHKELIVGALQSLAATYTRASDHSRAAQARQELQELTRQMFNEDAKNRVKALTSEFEGANLRKEAELLGLRSEDLQAVSEAVARTSRGKGGRSRPELFTDNIYDTQQRNSIEPRAETAVRIVTFGEFRVTIDGRELRKGDWQRKKARDLFKLLLINYRCALTVDEIVERLWQGASDRNFELLVMNAISHIRKALEPERRPHGETSFLTTNDGTYVLDFGHDASIDFLEFKELIVLARRSGSGAERRRLYEQAVQLYNGDFLKENLYEEWASSEREILKDAFLEALAFLADDALRDMNLEEAIATAKRILIHDNTNERGYEILLAAIRDKGDRAEMMRIVAECRRVYQVELGIEPPARLLREFGTGQ